MCMSGFLIPLIVAIPDIYRYVDSFKRKFAEQVGENSVVLLIAHKYIWILITCKMLRKFPYFVGVQCHKKAIQWATCANIYMCCHGMMFLQDIFSQIGIAFTVFVISFGWVLNQFRASLFLFITGIQFLCHVVFFRWESYTMLWYQIIRLRRRNGMSNAQC